MKIEGQPGNNNFKSEYFLHARKTLHKLKGLGFFIKRAGISTPVEEKEADLMAGRLKEILGRDMSLSIPHYFLKQVPKRSKG